MVSLLLPDSVQMEASVEREGAGGVEGGSLSVKGGETGGFASGGEGVSSG